MAQTDTNSVTILGRLVRDSEYREYGENGKELRFAIANNRGYGDFAHVNFIDCKLHGKRASSLQQYLVKGTQVAISGELSQDRWEDNQGNKRSNMFVEIGGGVQLLGGNGQANPTSNAFAAVPEQIPTPAQASVPSQASTQVFDADIPF